MQVSQKRIEANRANARKSTGPKDTSKTRFNGVKHGLTAQHAILPWEHREDLDAIIESFETRFEPVDNYERLLVKHAAEAFWRMERSLRLEASIFETTANAEYEAAGAQPGDLHAGHLEAMGFMKADEIMDRYRRYDAHLQRAFDKAMQRVEKMASLRKKHAEPLPAAEPVAEPPRQGLKECFAQLPLEKNAVIRVRGERLAPLPAPKTGINEAGIPSGATS